MNKRLFIKLHRTEIDRAINSCIYRNGGMPPPAPRFTDDEREQYLTNYPDLTSWAKQQGLDL